MEWSSKRPKRLGGQARATLDKLFQHTPRLDKALLDEVRCQACPASLNPLNLSTIRGIMACLSCWTSALMPGYIPANPQTKTKPSEPPRLLCEPMDARAGMHSLASYLNITAA